MNRQLRKPDSASNQDADIVRQSFRAMVKVRRDSYNRFVLQELHAPLLPEEIAESANPVRQVRNLSNQAMRVQKFAESKSAEHLATDAEREIFHFVALLS